MNKKGMSRPGAWQMAIAAGLLFLAWVLPLAMAVRQPTSEWYMSLTGMPAVLATLGFFALLILYIVGFVRYCVDKGYSPLMGFVLSLGSVLSLIVLLMLPDLRDIRRTPDTITRQREKAA